MSEYSESYHLRSEDQTDGVRLLNRAGVNGLVYPPANGWVTILADGEPFSFNNELLQTNQAGLLYYWCAEDHGWGFAIFEGDRLVSQYLCEWEKGIRIDDTQLNMPAICDWLRSVGIEGDLEAHLTGMLYPDKEAERRAGLPAHRFAGWLQLGQYEWHSYEYMAPEFDEDRPEFQGVVAVFHDNSVGRTNQRSAAQPNPDVTSRPESPRLPLVLYGDAPSTRKNWKKITTKAWKTGSWDNVLDNLELVPVENLPGGICLDVDRMTRASEKLWRVYWIAELLADAVMAAEKDSVVDIMERLDSLRLSGMNHFWFTLGLLQYSRGGFALSHWPRKTSLREINLKYLERFVHWLPELDACSAWIHDPLLGFTGISSAGLHFRNIFQTAFEIGCRWIQLNEVDAPNQGKLAAALLENGIVKPEGNRYRLTPPTITDTLVLLDSPDAQTRSMAASAIGRFGEAAAPAIPALFALLEDDGDEVREQAALSLAGLGPIAGAAVPTLMALIQKGDAALDRRTAAVVALGHIGPPAAPAIPTLIWLLGEDDMAGIAANALGALGPLAKEAIPALQKLIDDDRWLGFAGRALDRIRE
jgi:hypothetical protein